MEHVQQTALQATEIVERADRHDSLGIAREENGVCAVIGDPSGFIVKLKQELGRMQRHNDSSCLLMVIADAWVDLKAMDGLGIRFAMNLRPYDVLCRYGGNHFLVLLPHVQREDVSGIVRRLRLQVVGYPLMLADGTDEFVTATFGGAMLDPEIELHENIDRAVLAGRFGMRQGGDTDQMWAPSLEMA